MPSGPPIASASAGGCGRRSSSSPVCMLTMMAQRARWAPPATPSADALAAEAQRLGGGPLRHEVRARGHDFALVGKHAMTDELGQEDDRQVALEVRLLVDREVDPPAPDPVEHL